MGREGRELTRAGLGPWLVSGWAGPGENGEKFLCGVQSLRHQVHRRQAERGVPSSTHPALQPLTDSSSSLGNQLQQSLCVFPHHPRCLPGGAQPWAPLGCVAVSPSSLYVLWVSSPKADYEVAMVSSPLLTLHN